MARRGNPPLEIRLDADRRERWQAAADDAGDQLAPFVRDLVDWALDAREDAAAKGKRKPRPKAATAATPAAPTRAARTGMCVHRRRADQFCSRCDV